MQWGQQKYHRSDSLPRIDDDLTFQAGRLYTGRGNGFQSDDRCVMRQRTGASVLFERIREGAWFRSIIFARFLLRIYEKF